MEGEPLSGVEFRGYAVDFSASEKVSIESTDGVIEDIDFWVIDGFINGRSRFSSRWRD